MLSWWGTGASLRVLREAAVVLHRMPVYLESTRIQMLEQHGLMEHGILHPLLLPRQFPTVPFESAFPLFVFVLNTHLSNKKDIFHFTQ